MTYLEAVALLHDIESKYDVMSIKYKGVSVWSFLRLRLLDCVSVNTEIKMSKSVMKIVLKSLFYGSPLQAWKKYDVWAFTAAERRKQVGDKMIHRISGAIVHVPEKTLMIEKPSRDFGHVARTSIEEKDIISESWMLFWSQLFKRLPLVKKSAIESHQLMEKILEDYNIKFDYLHYVRHLDAQRRAMNLTLAIFRKPKTILFECPYDSMGYLWAFHQHGLKVIELQHGVLNRNHDAYNARDYDFELNPDSICVFGVEEYNYFKRELPKYAKNVEMTGLYMLEKADKFFDTDIFTEDRKKYEHIVVVSGQAGFEEQLGEYINHVAGKHLEALFVYIPRHNDVNLNFSHDNIRFVVGVNIYQYLKWADLHITVSSTTCFEAHYFHTPTLFYYYQKMASSYYGTVFAPENAVEYLSSEEGFDEAYVRLLNCKFEYREIFAHHHLEKIEKEISKYVK